MRAQLERGSILVEVVFLMVVLTLPVFYLVATLGRLQAGAYAVSAAVREAGRAYVTAPDAELAGYRAVTATGLVLQAHGFDHEDASVTVQCSAEHCLEPGAQVRFDGVVSVELPLIPDFMSGIVPTTIQLSASHLEVVDEFRGTP